MKKIASVFVSSTLAFIVSIGCVACKGSGGADSSALDSVTTSTSDSAPDSSSSVTQQEVYASARVMSINIAGQDMTTSDNITTVKYPGQTGLDYTYEKRRTRLDAVVEEFTPDVLFLQEVNGNDWWWPYLVSNEDSFLNTFTDYTLVGRTNRIGQSDGEGGYWYDLYNQLYYDSTKFESVATGMFYLNERRTEPFSRDWHESGMYDSDDNNTCVWAVLKDKKTGVSAVYASTHLKPTGGYLGRALTNYRQSIHLADGLYEIAESYGDDNGALPIVVGGDFNLLTSHEYNYAYPHMTEKAHYSDAQKIADKTDTSGTARVWGKSKVGAGSDGTTTDGSRIDLFFTQGMRVNRYQCLNGVFLEDATGAYYTSERIFDGSAYDLSDHLPIMIDVKIPATERTVLAPSSAFENTSSGMDSVLSTGNSIVSQSKIVFSGADILPYLTGEQYMTAEIVADDTYESVLRLKASVSCPNVYTYLDVDGLMSANGLSDLQISEYSKIKITYKTSLTVSTSELAVAVLNEGDSTVQYGKNTTKFTNSNDYTTQTLTITKGKNASGAITDILLGTMAYANDFSGVCGMFAGDCLYVYSIEFLK